MNLIIDVQGFKIENNRFIVKELAAYDGCHTSHHIFKQPFHLNLLPPDLQKQASWLIKHHHGISWDEGFTPLHKFSNIIKSLTNNCDCIYVKGAEKAKLIQKYTTKPVFELSEDPPLQPSEAQCFFHKRKYCICALTNVFLLYNYFFMDQK